jgi:hypothetical protein
MTRTRPAAAPLLALALALCLAPCAPARGAQAAAEAGRSNLFQRARQLRAEGPPESAAFEFEAGGFDYHVAANGNGRRTKGDRVRRFNLRLDGGFYIEDVRFALYEGNLLLLCGVSDAEGGGGLFLRLEQPSMRALWRQHVPAFNLGEPLREGRHLYLTGIGFVAKLDLRAGAYVWQHDDLYEARGGAAGGFEGFEKPELAGDAVLFRERSVYNRPRTLVVNKKTGTIIRIE